MKKALYTLASVTALSGLSAQADIDAEILTYNRNIFKQSPQEFAAKFPEFKWNADKESANSKISDLSLWGKPIKSVTLKGSEHKIDSLEFLLDESNNSQRALSTAWTSYLNNLTGKNFHRLPTRAVDGSTITSLTWESTDSILLLTSKSSDANNKLTLKVLSKTSGAGLVGNTRSPINSRSFYNENRSSAIEGSLLDYNPKNDLVKIQSENQTKSLNFKQLSEADQRYIKDNTALIAAIRGLELKFTEVKEDSVKAGNRTTVNTKFTIQAYNRSSAVIQDLELRYTILYRQGGVDKAGTNLKRETGKVDYSMLLAKYGESSDTLPIEIIKEVKPAQGGG